MPEESSLQPKKAIVPLAGGKVNPGVKGVKGVKEVRGAGGMRSIT